MLQAESEEVCLFLFCFVSIKVSAFCRGARQQFDHWISRAIQNNAPQRVTVQQPIQVTEPTGYCGRCVRVKMSLLICVVSIGESADVVSQCCSLRQLIRRQSKLGVRIARPSRSSSGVGRVLQLFILILCAKRATLVTQRRLWLWLSRFLIRLRLLFHRSHL